MLSLLKITKNYFNGLIYGVSPVHASTSECLIVSVIDNLVVVFLMF